MIKKARPHKFKVGDKVFIKIHNTGENEDTKLRKQYKGVYTISSFLSDTNVILVDDRGKNLPRSVYINNLRIYRDRNQYNNEDYIHRSNSTCSTEAEKSEYEDGDVTVQKENSGVNKTSQVIHMKKTNDESTNDLHKTEGKDDSESEETMVEDIEMPFRDLDDDALVKLVQSRDIQSQSEIEQKGYDIIKKVYRKRILKSGDIEYYLSWKHAPAKKFRTWVKRKDLSHDLQKYVDTRNLPCTFMK